MDITTEGSLDIRKLPAYLLGKLLSTASTTDPRVLLGPLVGADAAVIDMGDTVLVAKSDPVTFAADRIGWYAVQVNANDIACLGAMPKWFLATVLLPEGAAPELAEEIFREITDACAELGVALVGGHTEITYGLTRPIVSGHMLGEAKKADVVWPGGAQPGDTLLLTLGLAIEGTALLAREAANALRDGGMSDADVAAAASLLESPGISVVHAAQTACSVASVHAMHDPTEGGLATGIHELAEAAGLGASIEEKAIPLSTEGNAMCRALGLDPLGVITSGALLLAVPPSGEVKVREALSNAGALGVRIGRLLPAGEGVTLHGKDGPAPLPRYDSDEIGKIF